MHKSDEKRLLERQDEELVKLIQEGKQEALETLFNRYKGFIYEVSLTFMIENHIAQMYFDDLMEVAIDCLLIACQDFLVDQGKSFLNYWWGITDKRLMTFLQRIIDLRQVTYDRNIFPDLPDSNAEQIVYESFKKYHDRFTTEEKCLLEYLHLGYKPLEIAEFFSWNKSKLYRIKKKALDKLNKIIKSN